MSTYEGLGLSLPYPENWKVTEEKDGELTDSIYLESPKTAFLSITRYQVLAGPDAIVEEAVASMRSEYEEIECEDLLFDIGEDESFGCDLRFYCLDLLIVSRLIAFQADQRSFLIQFQAEDREFEGLRLVIHAMLVTAFKSLAPDLPWDELPK